MNEEMNEDILKLLKIKKCYLTKNQIIVGVYAETEDELCEVYESLQYLVDDKKIELKKYLHEDIYGFMYGDNKYGI